MDWLSPRVQAVSQNAELPADQIYGHAASSSFDADMPSALLLIPLPISGVAGHATDRLKLARLHEKWRRERHLFSGRCFDERRQRLRTVRLRVRSSLHKGIGSFRFHRAALTFLCAALCF